MKARMASIEVRHVSLDRTYYQGREERVLSSYQTRCLETRASLLNQRQLAKGLRNATRPRVAGDTEHTRLN